MNTPTLLLLPAFAFLMAFASFGPGAHAASQEPVMCTMQYAPVCGKGQDGIVRTYGNSCTLGAENATFLYEGECKPEAGQVPQQDLWIGKRGADVVWLQKHLISRKTGASAQALARVGATGYFGPLTRAALAEYQATYAITPTAGYFGPKTRAHMEGKTSPR